LHYVEKAQICFSVLVVTKLPLIDNVAFATSSLKSIIYSTVWKRQMFQLV